MNQHRQTAGIRLVLLCLALLGLSPQPASAWLSVAFSDKKTRDDFDEGLAELRKNGRYDKIIEKYVGR